MYKIEIVALKKSKFEIQDKLRLKEGYSENLNKRLIDTTGKLVSALKQLEILEEKRKNVGGHSVKQVRNICNEDLDEEFKKQTMERNLAMQREDEERTNLIIDDMLATIEKRNRINKLKNKYEKSTLHINPANHPK